MQKHAFHSPYTTPFIVTVFTNPSVTVPTGFTPYMSLTVHISMVTHLARITLTDALIVKTTQIYLFCQL